MLRHQGWRDAPSRPSSPLARQALCSTPIRRSIAVCWRRQQSDWNPPQNLSAETSPDARTHDTLEHAPEDDAVAEPLFARMRGCRTIEDLALDREHANQR